MGAHTNEFMRLWLSLPDSKENVALVMQDDGKGSFDVNQPAMRGTVSFCGGMFEMPFICVRADLTTPLPVPETVITYFRHGDEWLMTVTPGRRPNFLVNEASKADASVIGIRMETSASAVSYKH